MWLVPQNCDLCGSGFDLFTCPLWHHQPIPVTWLVRLWPILTLLVKEDTAVFKRSGAAPTNTTLHTIKDWRHCEAKHAQSLPMRISHVRVLLGRKKYAIKNNPGDNNFNFYNSSVFHFLSTVDRSVKLWRKIEVVFICFIWTKEGPLIAGVILKISI